VPAQPVDATAFNRLIGQYFPKRTDLYGSTQSEPKQGFVWFESAPANEISLVDSYKKTLSKCCIDTLRPPGLSECGEHSRSEDYAKPRLTDIIQPRKELTTEMKYLAPLAQVGTFCLVLATSLVAQREIFVPASDVSFKISTERSSYRAGELIILKYKIKNISNGPLYVPREWEATCPASPHLWAWFEDSGGKHFVPGFGGSCVSSAKTMSERMSKEAVLLKPGEHLDGTFRLDTKLFGGLKPGAYRIEAGLSGWTEEKFSDIQRSELAQMGAPYMRGEIPDATSIRLTASAK